VLLAQGRFWRASLSKSTGSVALEILRSSLDEEFLDLREFRIEAPLDRWGLVVKYVHSDRKLLGGLLLDFAKQKERVSSVVGNDRLFAELQRIVLDATAVLVEEAQLVLRPPKGNEE
jgi:hypothetical protein